MAMQQAHCMTCGDPVLHNPRTMGRISTKPETKGMPLTGWYHDDPSGAWRGHEAIPHDMRGWRDEKIRHDAVKNRARVAVNKTLDQQFLGLSVDDVFRDRR